MADKKITELVEQTDADIIAQSFVPVAHQIGEDPAATEKVPIWALLNTLFADSNPLAFGSEPNYASVPNVWVAAATVGPTIAFSNTAPTGQNSMMYLVAVSESGSELTSPPGGWTNIFENTFSNGTDYVTQVFAHKPEGVEDNMSFTFAGSGMVFARLVDVGTLADAAAMFVQVNYVAVDPATMLNFPKLDAIPYVPARFTMVVYDGTDHPTAPNIIVTSDTEDYLGDYIAGTGVAFSEATGPEAGFYAATYKENGDGTFTPATGVYASKIREQVVVDDATTMIGVQLVFRVPGIRFSLD